MFVVFVLWEVIVYYGDWVVLGVVEGVLDEVLLGFFVVVWEVVMQFQGCLVGEQGDVVVVFLFVVVDVVVECFDFGLGKLVVGDFGFLQFDYVGLVLFDQCC